MFVVTVQEVHDEGTATGPQVVYASEERPASIAFMNRICARLEVSPGQADMVLDTEDGQPRLTVRNPHLDRSTVYRMKEGL